jgi:ABC-2 type transport system ATP-binding protein
MAGQAALTADRLTKRFGERVAFQDVSFQVGHGEVFGFLGPNGAGKSNIGQRHFSLECLV